MVTVANMYMCMITTIHTIAFNRSHSIQRHTVMQCTQSLWLSEIERSKVP